MDDASVAAALASVKAACVARLEELTAAAEAASRHLFECEGDDAIAAAGEALDAASKRLLYFKRALAAVNGAAGVTVSVLGRLEHAASLARLLERCQGDFDPVAAAAAAAVAGAAVAAPAPAVAAAPAMVAAGAGDAPPPGYADAVAGRNAKRPREDGDGDDEQRRPPPPDERAAQDAKIASLETRLAEIEEERLAAAIAALKPPARKGDSLYNAANAGDFVRVKALVRLGGDVNKSEEGGRTLLWIAAFIGNLAVVQWLAGQDADIDKASNNGLTPLHVAANNGHLSVVQWLAGQGADINKASNLGRTPLASATVNKHDAIVAFFKSKGTKK